MVKKKWEKFAGRFKEAGCSRAEASRETGIHYQRLVGFLNGYWDLNEKEEKVLDDFLTSLESSHG